MNTDNLRFTKYIRVMMLALLTLCGNGVMGQTFQAYPGATEVIHKYQKYDNLVCDLTGEMSSILTKLGYSQASDMDNKGGYIRWSVINADGVNDNKLGLDLWNNPNDYITLRLNGQDKSYWWTDYIIKRTNSAYYWYSGFSSSSDYQFSSTYDNCQMSSALLKMKLVFAQFQSLVETFPGYSVSCYIANEPFNTSANTEPQIDIQYVFHFNETGASPVDPFENTSSISEIKEQSENIYEALSPTSASITLNGATAPSYIRWYFADASGNAVANPGFNLTNGSYTYTSQGNSIYYGGTTTDTNAKLLNMTVTPQNGKSWSDLTSYKLVALLSNAEGTVTDGTLTQEPLIATKYEISFEIVSFEGSTTGAKSLSETIRLEDDAMSSVTLSLPLSSVQDYMANEASSFYIRYYLTDKSGNRVALPTGVSITPTDNNITLISNDYGHYWFPSTGIGSITELGVTVANTNSTVDLRDYNVVAVMSSNEPLEALEGVVTYEPREMEVVYTYELKKPVDNSFDGACIGDAIYITKKINEGETTITLTDVRNDWGTLKYTFPIGNDYGPAYRRVYIRNKRTKELLDNQSDWIEETPYNSSTSFYIANENGSFWTKITCSNDSWQYTNFTSYNAYQYVLSPTINVPNGVSTSLVDCEVVMVLASGSETWIDGMLAKGPEEHEVEYIFRFTDGVDRFSGSLKDGVKPVNQSILVNSGTTSYTLSNDDCEILKKALGGSNPAYIRWYLVDADDNKMNETQSWITCPNGYVEGLELNQGYYWYDGTYTDELLGVKITVPAGYSIFDYQLVAVASKEPVADENIEDGTVITEPDWDAQCYFKFEEKFRGTLSDEAPKKKYTMVLPTTHWDDYAEYKILFDKDNNQLLLQDEENTVLYKVDDPFTELASLNVDYANGPFYIRWFLRDKTTGEETYIEGSLGNYSTNSDDAIFVDGGKKGLYWTSQLQSEQNIASSLRITVDRTPDGGSAFNMTDYELVMHVSNQEIPAGYLNTDGGVLYHEPDELQLEYSIQFVNKPFLSADTAFEEERKRYAYYDNETGKIAINFNKEERANIVDYFNTSNALPFGTNYYIRWSLEDKEGNVIPLTNSEDECLVVSAYNTSKYISNDIGLYMYSKWVDYSYIPEQELTMTVTPPTGMLYTDLRIVFAITTNLEGIDEKIENGFVTDIYSEPNNIQLRYVYTPIIENEVPFVHYKGVTGRDWEVVQSNPYVDKFNNQAYDASNDVEYVETGDVRQGTHEWTYEMYAPLSTDDTKSYKTFVLPIMKVDDVGDSYEPRAYFRWYDWDTDFSSEALSPYDSDKTKLKEWFFQTVGNEKKSRGLFAWNLTENAVVSNVAAVNYLMPKDTDWEGDTIACEISKFLDGWNEAADLIEHEPTLLYRYKYIIRPASVIADKIVAGVKGANRALYEEELLENHGNVTLAVIPEGDSYKGTTTLRLNLSDVNNYYFYPYNAVNQTWDKTNNKIYEAESIIWTMYDASGKKLGELPPKSEGNNIDYTFCKVAYAYNGPKIGELFYVIAFAANGSYSAPIAKFNCKFVDNSHPILFEESDMPYFRSIDYLEENYTRVALISFDVEEGSTLTSPTDQIDNANPYPFAWKRSHYGYCYPQLYNALTSNAAQDVGLGALHGDYRLVKKAWEAGASYVELWHGGRGLFDRTYQLTNGLQSGYFLYVDASDESRPIANVQFEGDMCVGSTVVLSAAVADMTSNASVHPQLMFKLYGIHLDADGNETERKLIHSFATADFFSLGCGAVGEWYQTYAKITLRGNSGVENYQNFLVSIDNYCDGTLGADYAIDDIRIYVQNSKVEVKQNTIPCGEDPINFDFRVRYETLSGFLSADPNDFPQPICFRICDEEGNAVTGDYDNGTNTNYGVAFAPYTFDEASDYCETDASGNQYFVFTGESGMLLDLDPEKKYDVSVAIPQGYTKEETVVEVETIVDGETIVTQKTVTTYTCTFASDDVWGNPSKICSMYSRVFQPLKQYMKLSVGGSVISSINISCGKRNTDEAFGANKYSIAGQLQIPDKSTGGFITVNDTELCPFDWYVEVKGGDANLEFTTNLKNALKRFRTVYPTATSLQEANGVFTTDDYNLLNLAITRGAPNNTNGKLYLYNGTNVLVGPNYVVGNTYIITAIPIKEKIVYQEKPYEVCPEPMEVTVEARLNGPELKLGFNDVLYPSTLPQGANVLRVGLAQLKNMRENGVPLHLPVYGYKDMNKGQENPLLLDEFGLMLVDTNDPTWDEYLNTDMWVDAYRLATGLKPNENLHEITAENNSVELYFHENWHTVKELEWWNNSWVNTVDTKRPIEFHEGYWYEVSFRYIDQTEYVSKSPSQRCYGEAYFTIKIVPEYVTWGEGLPNNSNWLNDENWSRSNVEELYKTTTNSDDYKNNAKIDERLENKGFVPMKFSKVTILGGISTPYPYLYNLEKDYHSGILKRTTNGDNSVATTDIEYDMMVKIEPEYCPNETDETNNVKVYECEKFYGNECEQIYFKPGAQLRYQHYLAYNRAWVDFELETDQWYMLTSPLSNLYAGDMFVPAKNSLDYFGRQETEAFQEIAFKGLADDNGIYSRTKYPIYQRSWDRVSSLVVTPKDDQRAPEYDAFIDYTDEDWANSEMNVVFSQWSHVYNELDEEYIPGMGFSIKAHKEKQTEKALIRLPKNDTEYTYYSYDDKPGEIKASLSNRVDDAQYKLATKDIVTGIFTVNPHDHDGECDYYQVGNPYMASMNMDLFFNQNMHLERKYWTIVSGVLHTVDGSGSMGYVGPMQSFFVKAIDGGVVESVTFSPYMTVSSNAVNTVSEGESGQMLSFTTRATANVPMAQTRVVLSAEADNGFVDEEDVETLLDSNLEDVPMVYTVAGTQAAMVNRLNDVTLLPLGLFGAEGETVDVQVHGVDRFSQTLYFYDASTGKQTALEEGTALSLEANVHGRYFLTTRALEDDVVTDDTDWQVRAYSLQRGELIVAAMPQDNLRQVRIYGVNGHQVVNDAAAQSHVATYALPSGIYVAEVVTERLSRPQVVKVVVR